MKKLGRGPLVVGVLFGVAYVVVIVVSVAINAGSQPKTPAVFSERWLQKLPTYRRLDGAGNSPHKRCGLVDTKLARRLTPSSLPPDDARRPSLGDVSEFFASESVVAAAVAPESDDGVLSAYAWLWGQFIDHTLLDTDGVAVDAVNRLTPFLDASTVYSCSETTLASLRDGALMRTNGTLLPGWPRFLFGDARGDVHALLLAMHTVWVREHNWWARRLMSDDDNDDGAAADHERIFQSARAIVIAEMQVITYREWLPLIVGRRRAAEYAPRWHDAKLCASIETEFATACFRYGHSMVAQRTGGLDLVESFRRGTDVARARGIEPLLWAAAGERAERVDTCIVDALRTTQNFTMPALNVARGRQRRLASYAAFREAWDVPAAASWIDVTQRSDVAHKMQRLYGPSPSAEHVDAYVGMLAEPVDVADGAAVGATLGECIADQFRAVAEADAYFYEWTPHDDAFERYRDEVRATTLGAVLRRTASIDFGVGAFFLDSQQ